MLRILTIPFFITLMLACAENGYPQKNDSKPKEHKLRVYVSDEDGNILAGIVLCSKGKGVPSEPTDITGRTEIALSDDAIPGEPIDLILVGDVKANHDWEIVPGARILIHAFNDKPNTFSTVPLRRKTNHSEGPEAQRSVETYKAASVDAVGDLTEALQKKQGELVIIYIQLGHTLYDQKRYTDALTAYKTALASSPDNDEILYAVTIVFVQLEKYSDALSMIEKCLQIRKGQPESIDLAVAYETYASVLASVNRKTESIEQLATARAIRGRLTRSVRKQ